MAEARNDSGVQETVDRPVEVSNGKLIVEPAAGRTSLVIDPTAHGEDSDDSDFEVPPPPPPTAVERASPVVDQITREGESDEFDIPPPPPPTEHTPRGQPDHAESAARGLPPVKRKDPPKEPKKVKDNTRIEPPKGSSSAAKTTKR